VNPVRSATCSYEAWIGKQVSLVRADLRYKHEQMSAAAFPFLRATYYRWAELFPAFCGELAGAPRVLGGAPGDAGLHSGQGRGRDPALLRLVGVHQLDQLLLVELGVVAEPPDLLAQPAGPDRLALCHGDPSCHIHPIGGCKIVKIAATIHTCYR